MFSESDGVATYGFDGVFKTSMALCNSVFQIPPTNQHLNYLILGCLIEQLARNLGDTLARRALVSNVVCGLNFNGEFNMLFDDSADWDVLVEDICFELFEGVLLSLGLQTLVFLKGQAVWENGVNTVVHVGFVIKPFRNEVDVFKLVGATRC